MTNRTITPLAGALVMAGLNLRGRGVDFRRNYRVKNPDPSDDLTDGALTSASTPATAPASIQAREVLGGKLIILTHDHATCP